MAIPASLPRAFCVLFTAFVIGSPALAFDQEPAVPDLDRAAVTLPWTEVKRLLDQVRENEKKEEARTREAGPPKDVVLEGVTYGAVVGRSSTDFEARFDLDVLSDAWQQVRLLGAGPSIVSATLDGEPARLVLDEGWYSVVTRGRGRKSAVLRFVLPRGTEAGDSTLDLLVAPSPRNHLELQVPRPAIAVAVEPNGSLRHSERNGATRVSADFPLTDHLKISWSGALPEDEIQAAKVLRRCAVSQLVSVGGGLIRLDARLTFSILQGKVERFDLQLPPDTTLLDVSGEVVREHRVVKHDGGSAVAVSLIRPMTGIFTVRVQAERALDASSTVAAVPELRILDVEREWGHIGINATTNIEVAPTGVKGLTAIDVKELPAEVWQAAQQPILLSYRYLGHPYELLLDVRRHADLPVLASTIDTAWVTSFQTSDGKVLHSALFQTKNTHKQFMKVKLPERTKVLAAFVSDLPVKPAANEAGEVLIPLEKSTAEKSDQKPFPVELVYLTEGQRMRWLGRSELQVPRVDIPISVFHWTLHVPRTFTYWAFSGNLERANGTDAAARQAAERLESHAAAKGPGEVGLLPVRINLPTSGLRYSFQKELLMVDDRPPALSFRFVGAGFTRALRGLIGLAAILVAVRAALVLLAARKSTDMAPGLRRLTWLVGGLVAVVAIETWVFGAAVPSIAATLIAAILCTDLHLSGARGKLEPAAA